MNTDYILTEEETARVEIEVEKERKYLQAVRKCTDKEIEKMLLLVRKRAEQNIIYLKLKKKEGEARLRTARCEVVRESLVEEFERLGISIRAASHNADQWAEAVRSLPDLRPGRNHHCICT